MLLSRLSPIPSLIFSGSVFVASSLPDSSLLLLFSQSGVPRSFPVLAASFPVLPCFFPAPSLCFHGPSPFLPGPSPILPVPFLFSPVWWPRRPPAASLLPCFAQLLPHCSSVFPHCSACPLCLSLLLTWSLPVLLMVLQLSFPSLAGSLPVRPCFPPTLYCHFFDLLRFMAIALLPCSFQVLLTPCLVKNC